MISAVAILVVAAVLLYKIISDRKEYQKKLIIDYALALVEEGIAYSEEKNRMLKREAANNIAKTLKSHPVEQTKDPIYVDKFFYDGMKPAREIAHNDAKKYIIDSLSQLPEGELKKVTKKIIEKNIDVAIGFRIAATRLQINDSLRPLFYRSM